MPYTLTNLDYNLDETEAEIHTFDFLPACRHILETLQQYDPKPTKVTFCARTAEFKIEFDPSESEPIFAKLEYTE